MSLPTHRPEMKSHGHWVMTPIPAEVRALQEKLHALGWGVGDLAGVPDWPEDAVSVVEGLIEALVLAERKTEELRSIHRELRSNTIPTNCTHCKGSGAEPPGCPESGPCEWCGGWTAHKRLLLAQGWG